MAKFDVVLWDVDGTLLNFHKAERLAISGTFRDFGLPELSEEDITCYSQINASWWKRLELGQVTKKQLLPGRFREFMDVMSVHVDDIDGFNVKYQMHLGDTIVFNDNGYDIVKSLKDTVKQYAVTNGAYIAQCRKLKNSGLDMLFDRRFISDEVGAEKPKKAFFDYVFAHIEPVPRERVLIVGDSLTSDIAGGNVAGIPTCWYNPTGQTRPENLRIDFELHNLNGIYDILSIKKADR